MASLSQWGTDQNLHTIRENRFRLSFLISVLAGNTLSSTPGDRFMVTLQPCSAQPISALDLNPQVTAEKESGVFPSCTGMLRAREVHY